MGEMIAAANEWRDQASRTTWALCWQAAVGRDFLASPWLATKIRSRLIEAHRHDQRELIDFLLLPMEIHAIASIGPEDSVGSVARGVGNVVSRWVRQVQPVRGPVLAGRFWSQRIDSDDALRAEVRMLAWRPVVRQVSVTASYHPHGGLRAALGLTTSKGFDPRPLLRHFGSSVPAARSALRQWISRRPSAHDWRTWELTRGLVLAISADGEQPRTAKPVGRAAAALIAAGGGYGIEGALHLLEAWVSLRMQAPGMRGAALGHAGLRPRVRALVACLAVNHQLCPASAVARHFRRAKATFSEQMTACRARSWDRALIATPLRRILEECASLPARGDARGVEPPHRSRGVVTD